MRNNFLWKGCSGINSLIGHVVQNEPIKIEDKSVQNRLLNAGLIEPLNSNVPKEKNNGGRKNETRSEINDGSNIE